MKRKKKRWKKPVSYREYLKSDRWFRFRERILLKRGRKCEECGRRELLELHHLSYVRLGHERPADVKILCKFCHSVVDRHHMKQSGYAFLGVE